MPGRVTADMRGRPATAPPKADSAGVSVALRGAWLTLGKDGRLTLYVPAEGGLRRWTEERPGGPDWGQPVLVPVPGLTHLSVTQDAHAYVHLVGRRERGVPGGGSEVDIVHAVQYQTGRPVSQWRSLGNPHKEAEFASRVSEPVVVMAGSGAVDVFVRNASGGLAHRQERGDGKWLGWQEQDCGGLEGNLAAVALASGRIELFATTREGVLHWSQQEAGGALGEGRPARLAAAPGTLAVLETGPDRPTCYWADPGGRGAVAFRAGGWPMALGGAPGDGAQTVTRARLDGYDCTLLAHRSVDGTATAGICVTENEANGMWWTDTGVRCLGAPALVQDAVGAVVMAVVGEDETPRIARQVDGPGLTLSEWRAL